MDAIVALNGIKVAVDLVSPSDPKNYTADSKQIVEVQNFRISNYDTFPFSMVFDEDHILSNITQINVVDPYPFAFHIA